MVLVGDMSVGKSSMIKGITDGFPPGPPIIFQTLALTFPSVPFKCMDYKITNLQIWDTAGRERSNSSLSGHLGSANYDLQLL